MLSGSVSPGALVDSGVGEVDFSTDRGMVKVHRGVAQSGFLFLLSAVEGELFVVALRMMPLD